MLASITPLGERGRGHHYSLTVGSLVAGSTLSAVLLGAGLGGVGAVIPLETEGKLAVMAVALGTAVLWDSPRTGLVLPTTKRQVDAGWLDTYRGGIYGLGFGVQLGAAVVTVVTSALTYVWLLAAALSGSLVGGAVVGVSFGLGRGLAALPASGVHGPEDLRRLWSGLQVWDRRTRRLALMVECGLALVIGTVLVIA